MKKPLYALLIAADREMRQAIIEGRKQITIREGYREYHVFTTVMLCDHEEPWAVMADITEVYHKLLGEVIPAEWEDDGYNSQEEMLGDLRQFYPNIGLDSAVTIIYWEKVRGKLVEEWKELRQSSSWVLQNS